MVIRRELFMHTLAGDLSIQFAYQKSCAELLPCGGVLAPRKQHSGNEQRGRLSDEVSVWTRENRGVAIDVIHLRMDGSQDSPGNRLVTSLGAGGELQGPYTTDRKS